MTLVGLPLWICNFVCCPWPAAFLAFSSRSEAWEDGSQAELVLSGTAASCANRYVYVCGSNKSKLSARVFDCLTALLTICDNDSFFSNAYVQAVAPPEHFGVTLLLSAENAGAL